jgi:hypothetical protein
MAHEVSGPSFGSSSIVSNASVSAHDEQADSKTVSVTSMHPVQFRILP